VESHQSTEHIAPPLSRISGAGKLDPRRIAAGFMLVGTVILAVLFLRAMLKQPFEPIDDLIWLTKLKRTSFGELAFSPTWRQAPFYRPVADIFLKSLYSSFDMDLRLYRWTQFGCFIVLVLLCAKIFRQLRLPWESGLIIAVFLMGSPFVFGSLSWITELPHVIVLICYASALVTILSNQTPQVKLLLCLLAFVTALLSKENGLALAVFWLYFVRTLPVRATLAFGGIVSVYFALRALSLGPAMGLGGMRETVGYFFDYLSHEQMVEKFPGHEIYKFFAYNIAAQFAALFFRVTQWGVVLTSPGYQFFLHTLSTILIIVGLGGLIRTERRIPAWLLIVSMTVLGGTLFSYAYARDRHLLLPAFAYGFLLVQSCATIGRLAGSRSITMSLLFLVWLAWSVQAYRIIKTIPPAGLELVEKIYQPNPEAHPVIDRELWAVARRQALELAKR
jgi:hypothetical protein